MQDKYRILWVSQHPPLAVQINALKALFGPVEVVQDPNSFDSAEDILKRFKTGGYKDMVVVAPLSVIMRLNELGVKPLHANMQQIEDKAQSHLTFKGRHLKFMGFTRIEVKIEHFLVQPFEWIPEQILSLAPIGTVNQVNDAIKLARARHAELIRIGGEPYIGHVLRVALAMLNHSVRENFTMQERLNCLLGALFHDIVEDTETSIDEISAEYGAVVAKLVTALSHIDEEEGDEVYMARVATGGEFALLIKLYDRLDNIKSLAQAPKQFRVRKLAEIRKSLPIWQRYYPEAVELILAAVEEQERSDE